MIKRCHLWCKRPPHQVTAMQLDVGFGEEWDHGQMLGTAKFVVDLAIQKSNLENVYRNIFWLQLICLETWNIIFVGVILNGSLWDVFFPPFKKDIYFISIKTPPWPKAIGHVSLFLAPETPPGSARSWAAASAGPGSTPRGPPTAAACGATSKQPTKL